MCTQTLRRTKASFLLEHSPMDRFLELIHETPLPAWFGSFDA
jgi:hypothetical protein